MSKSVEDVDSDGEEFWQSVADQMSGLMLVFLFIAVSYALHVNEQKASIEEVAVAYNKARVAIYRSLDSTFKEDLQRWNAEVDSVTLSVRFREPDVLFTVGSSVVQPRFQDVLRSFFPRYVEVIRRHGESVEEIRIEGHTSTEGPGANPYYYNMELSQERTRAVLQFCLESTSIRSADRDWVQSLMTANGLSSSRLVRRQDGREDRRASRRVEFRVRTNAEVRLAEILQRSN